MILPEIIGTVRGFLKEGENCYLVGGAVRDLLLGRAAHDLDFCASADPRRLARSVADRVGGAFYVMDEARRTSRVLLETPKNPQLVLDFSALQETLQNDLLARDFTINAMAIDLRDTERVIDPLKGARDLQEKWLRPCSPDSFSSDPVRTIRAVRYAANLSLRIEPATRAQLGAALPLLANVSLERKRDELFRILELDNSLVAVLLMRELKLLKELGLSSTVERLPQYRSYEQFAAILCASAGAVQREFFTAAAFISAFSYLKPDLASYLCECNSGWRSRLQLAKYFLLLPPEQNVTRSDGDLASIFARPELELIQDYFDHQAYVMDFIVSSQVPTRRDIYRFFNRVGEEAPGLILLVLAGIAGRPAVELAQAEWLRVLQKAALLLDAWFHQPETCRPQPLLNGEEIMAACQLDAGPLVGQLLAALKEEQAAGEITSPENALAWLTEKCHQARES